MNDTSQTSFDGGCTCGAVRYRVDAPPMLVHCCHCTWCQRETGSAFAVNALIEAPLVAVTKGAPQQVTLPSASGQGQVFTRCTACGVTLWSNYAAAQDKVHFLRVGTLDDPSQMPPDIYIFTSSKQPWVVLPEGTPAVEEYYQRSAYWPADSVARYKAARDG